MKHGGFIAFGLCAAMVVGCGKSSEKAAPAAQPTTAPTVAPAKPGGGLAALLNKGAGPAPSAQRSPVSGMFGGGLQLGGGAARARDIAAAAEGEQPTPPAAPAPAAKQASGATPSGDCGKAGTHVAALLRTQMGGDLTAEMAAEMATELSRMCSADNWPPAALACVLASKTVDNLDDCQEQLPYGGGDTDEPDDLDEPRDDFEMPDMDFGSAEPVPSSDAKCDAVGAHAFALLASDSSAVPEDQRAAMAGMKVYVTNMIAAECVKQQFPAVTKDCILAAKTIAETEKCGI